MEFVRSHGYPVPEVFEVSEDGRDLVMERIDGPTMVEAGAARPWKLRHFGSQLARLHQALHLLPAPAWVADAPCGRGDRLLHMDLHPLNVLMAGGGPMVIDWPNAVRGDPAVDVALTWALIASGEIPAGRVLGAVMGMGRGLLLNAFLKPVLDDDCRAILSEVVEWKSTDPHMSAAEIDRMRALARSAGN
jgi:aminoglycoside phosphotransferase (APT) family kinase protein